jgi:hypothetical protein
VSTAGRSTSAMKELEVFAVAYVILPFSDTEPAEAIGTSLARFQRGQPFSG